MAYRSRRSAPRRRSMRRSAPRRSYSRRPRRSFKSKRRGYPRMKVIGTRM